MKGSWEHSADPIEGYGPNTLRVELLLARARHLSRSQILQLDALERQDADILRTCWNHARDRLRVEPRRSWGLNAGNAAWEAVQESARAHGIEPPAVDGYSSVVTGPAYGAARAARFAAAALIAPEALEPEYLDILVRPWRSVVGE